jgi:1,4-alpha-glucan branching enzyme
MINKSYYNNGRTCRVTFRSCPADPAETVHLVSNVDDWDTAARPMTKRKDGCFSTSLVLSAGARVHFRYLVDGERWINDDEADELVSNEFGDSDGVVNI